MPKRYYYTDPLAAAYMAREFGVKFCVWHEGTIIPIDLHSEVIEQTMGMPGSQTQNDRLEIKWDTPFYGYALKSGEKKPYIDRHWKEYRIHEKCYLHPDSLHLLDLQMGDLIWWEDDGWLIETIADLKHTNGSKIIQRNGKPFFWPESEEAE